MKKIIFLAGVFLVFLVFASSGDARVIMNAREAKLFRELIQSGKLENHSAVLPDQPGFCGLFLHGTVAKIYATGAGNNSIEARISAEHVLKECVLRLYEIDISPLLKQQAVEVVGIRDGQSKIVLTVIFQLVLE